MHLFKTLFYLDFQMDDFWASWKTMSESELHKLGTFVVLDSECPNNTPNR